MGKNSSLGREQAGEKKMTRFVSKPCAPRPRPHHRWPANWNHFARKKKFPSEFECHGDAAWRAVLMFGRGCLVADERLGTKLTGHLTETRTQDSVIHSHHSLPILLVTVELVKRGGAGGTVCAPLCLTSVRMFIVFFPASCTSDRSVIHDGRWSWFL